MDKEVAVSVGFGKRKGPLGGAESLRIVHLCAKRRRAARPGAGRLLTPESLELFWEGLHLSINGFDREEGCQLPGGRVWRGVREKGREEGWEGCFL